MLRFISFALIALSISTPPALAQRFHPRFRFPFISPNVSFVTSLPPGRFVSTAVGTINIGNRMFVPTTTGATSILRGEGVFMPASGTFVPAFNGNFLLTTREAFNTKTGTFSPSPTGQFLFSTRGDLVSNATKMAVGSFLPFVPSVPLAASLTTPTPVAINPYAANPYMNGIANPYLGATTNPYIPMYMPSYPTTNTSAAAGAVYGNSSQAGGATRALDQAALGTFGIAYENGHIKWPLAFRLLPPDKKQSLADPLEAQLTEVMMQGAGGNVGGAKKSVARLAHWLTEHQADMAEATYQDGVAFLQTLDAALSKY